MCFSDFLSDAELYHHSVQGQSISKCCISATVQGWMGCFGCSSTIWSDLACLEVQFFSLILADILVMASSGYRDMSHNSSFSMTQVSESRLNVPSCPIAPWTAPVTNCIDAGISRFAFAILQKWPRRIKLAITLFYCQNSICALHYLWYLTVIAVW